jgi:hypothetical protein
MKYSVLLAERRGAAAIEDAERIVGGEGMLRLARQAGWLTPQVQGNRLTLFDYDECIACWKRICMEGYEALKQSAENQKTPSQFHRH